jgi:hypothetical protein
MHVGMITPDSDNTIAVMAGGPSTVSRPFDDPAWNAEKGSVDHVTAR